MTFDAGQTLVELDLDFLASRLAERGIQVTSAALTEAAPAAWRHYDALVRAGADHPWNALIGTLVAGASPRSIDGTPIDVADHVEWLRREQPRNNLWRRPIPEMIAVVRDLVGAGATVAVVSNSEGHLEALLDDLGLLELFATVIDSGRLGVAKPDPRIFAHTLAALGRSELGDDPPIHIGDSWEADVQGAVGAGWRAIWFGAHATTATDPRVASARDAAACRAALERWTRWPP